MPTIVTKIQLGRDEICAALPYAVICEGRYGSGWNTAKRKREWAEKFTEEERGKAEKIFRQAYRWHLVTGVPEKVELTPGECLLWRKIGEFCARV